MNDTAPAVRSVALDDVSMRFLEYDGKGPDLVFLHATGFTPWLWHPIAREFSGTHHIVAPYFCEQRTGDPEAGGINWHILAADVGKLYRRLGLRSPVVVGHSIGATVATIAEAEVGPLAEGMVLFEPIFFPEEFYSMNPVIGQHPLASKAIKRGNFWNSAGEAREYFLSRELFRAWDDEMVELYIAHGLVPAGEGRGLTLACPPRQEAALFMGDTIFNPWPLAPAVRCPVLVVEGGRSEIKQFIDCGKTAAGFPHGSHMLVGNSGHLIPMEDPAGAVEVIRGFLDKL